MQEKKDIPSPLVTKGTRRRMPLGVRLFLSIIFLIGTIVYSISPIDLIPDVLGPIGWVDDILLWVLLIVVDMKLLLQQGMKKGKEINNNLKDRDGFFGEDV